MKGRIVTGLMAVLTAAVLSVQPALADPSEHAERGYGKGHGECCEGGHGGGYGMGMPGHHASTGHLLRGLLRSQKEIGLSEDQVNKLKALQLDLDKTRIKTEADIMVAERELASLVEDGKSDLGAIEAKVKQSESLQVGLRMAAIKARRDAMAVLTPEQSERIKMVHEKMQQGMGGMMGEHRGGAPRSHPKKDDSKKESKP